MSVQENYYVMIGLYCKDSSLFYEKDEYGCNDIPEKLEDYIDSPFKGIQHTNDLCLLIDGMCGGYSVLGHVLSKSDEYGEGAEHVCLSDAELRAIKIKVFDDITTHFSEWLKSKNYEFTIDDIKLISLTHYR